MLFNWTFTCFLSQVRDDLTSSACKDPYITSKVPYEQVSRVSVVVRIKSFRTYAVEIMALLSVDHCESIDLLFVRSLSQKGNGSRAAILSIAQKFDYLPHRHHINQIFLLPCGYHECSPLQTCIGHANQKSPLQLHSRSIEICYSV